MLRKENLVTSKDVLAVLGVAAVAYVAGKGSQRIIDRIIHYRDERKLRKASPALIQLHNEVSQVERENLAAKIVGRPVYVK